MRHCVRELCALVQKVLPLEGPVYEVGSYQVQPAHFSDMRPLFPGQAYIGLDVRPGPGVDAIVDIHEPPIQDDMAGVVLCLDALEHIERPWAAVEQMHRILRPGGVLVLATVFNFEMHDRPDFWRFTPAGLEVLMRSFAWVYTGQTGGDPAPETVFGLAVKAGSGVPEALPLPRDVDLALEDWRFRWRRQSY